MKQKPMLAPFLFALAAAVAGSILRMWSLNAAIDEQGLPTNHISNYVFAGVSIAVVIVFLLLSYRSPGRSGRHTVLVSGAGSFVLSMAAAALILVGSGMEFGEALIAGPGISAPIMCLLGLLGSICCMVSACFRRRGQTAYPVTELVPILYLIIKLIFNFKSWSIDPIILDYCVILFALIFTLLAFHRGAGFVFDHGKPRAALFYAMTAVYFCAAAMMDGIADLKLSTIVTYCGFLLWQLPVILCLLVPSGPDPAPARKGRQNASA